MWIFRGFWVSGRIIFSAHEEKKKTRLSWADFHLDLFGLCQKVVRFRAILVILRSYRFIGVCHFAKCYLIKWLGGSPTNAVLNLSASMYVLSVMSARDTDLSDYTSTIVIAVIVAILKYTDNYQRRHSNLSVFTILHLKSTNHCTCQVHFRSRV